MGVVDLLSAALSRPNDRLRAIARLVPNEVLDTSRTFTLLAGALLLVTAWGLARGKRRSFVFALLLCAVSVPVNMLKAFDFEEATVAVAMMFALGVTADAFQVRSRGLRWADLRSGAMWAVAGLLAYAWAGSWWVGHQLGRPLSPITAFLQGGSWLLGLDAPTADVLPPDLPHRAMRVAEWYLRSLPTLSITILVGLMIAALRPASRRRQQSLEHDRAAALVREHGRATVSAFALAPDTDWFFSRSGRALIAYRHVGDVLLAIGDPIGAPEEQSPVLRDFERFAEAHDWRFAFYQATPEVLPVYRELGWRALHVGEEPVLDCATFTLAGGGPAEARRAVNKAERAGLVVRFFHPVERRLEPGGADHALFQQLHDVSAQWSAAHAGGEMELGMGRFSADRLQQAWLAVAVRADGRVEGFVTWEPVWARRGWTLDLMRRRDDSAAGTMELLVVRSVEAARARGDAMLSLALSALVQVPDPGGAREDPGAERAREFLRQRLAGIYDFDGLFRWKRKFGPRFEHRYLVHPTPFALPAILLALARAQAPGGWGALARRVLAARPRVVRAAPEDERRTA